MKQLNEITRGRYSVVVGDTIQAEIWDIKEHLPEIENLYYKMLEDEKSRQVLFDILAYRVTRRQEFILSAFSPDCEQYFDSTVALFEKDCVYVDCGGLDGYTAAKFMLQCPSYKRIYIYEPIKEYYEECLQNTRKFNVDNIEVRNAAVTNFNGNLSFDVNVKGSSRASELGEVTVPAVSLDADISEPIQFIKMDIEGSEKQALRGAEQHIKADTPMLAICVYHLPSDLWQVAQLINSINSEYTFRLRHHQTNTDETVLYAIPKCHQNPDVSSRSEYSLETALACREFTDEIEALNNKELFQSKAYILQQLTNYREKSAQQCSIISELRHWNQQLQEAKVFLERQITNRDESINEIMRSVADNRVANESLQGELNQLHKWVVDLESAKTFWWSQAQSLEANISDLKEWTSQLEEAKLYWQTQASDKDRTIQELTDRISKLEGGKSDK
ncbi:FkbM family methyltransferase [Alicyclobacillus mengziensis]|uniref:FkbM family methyltransferase n=1 Tax=Alicyclobacillus mengziensis TaxID=2931921 RepID=A0A9X7VZ48_9BACL|nr:FkbM family methyltransferase [Alicyclobacillus mengziensis]QSO47527.1 FkbM family methyltransferase [Alicyclobacillus mengziensis]